MIAAVVAGPASAQGSQSADQQLAAKYVPVLSHSLNFINLAAASVYAVTVPYAAIQLTRYYFDLEAREGAEPVAAG